MGTHAIAILACSSTKDDGHTFGATRVIVFLVYAVGHTFRFKDGL